MEFGISEEQQIMIDSLRKFLQAEIKPIAERYKDQLIPKAEMKNILKQLLDFGLGNGPIPEAYGGFDLDAVTIGLLQHELARISPDIAITVLIQMTAGKLMSIAPEALKEKYLKPLAAGEKIGCVAMSEPGAGSEVTAVNCRARQDGDSYVLNGEKMWISSGDYSDFTICLTRVNPDPVGGLTLFLVDREHGYESTNIHKTALNSQSTAQLFFDDVRVPAENMLVQPGEALKTLLTLLASSRPLVALMALGIGQAALDEAINYSLERTQYSKPIAGHQLIQAKIAEMATKLEAGKLLAFRALDNIDNKVRSDVSSAMSKWFGTELACEIVNDAVQIHGGNGITREFAVEYMQRAVRVFPFTEGTTEIQKLLIGRALLGVPAF
mgnify:CR=1 FL=1